MERDKVLPYPETTCDDHLLSPSNFRPSVFNPFFTLVEDAETGEHYHPFVHYIFQDDDPELLTAASMQALGADTDELGRMSRPVEKESRPSPLPPSQPGIKERYMLVDMGGEGQTVRYAHSMSPAWQILSTRVGAAPTWGDEPLETGRGEALMLTVSGMENSAGDEASRIKAEEMLEEATIKSGNLWSGIDRVLGQFNKRMEVLETVFGHEPE